MIDLKIDLSEKLGEKINDIPEKILDIQGRVLKRVAVDIKKKTLSNLSGLFKHSGKNKYIDNIEDGVRVRKTEERIHSIVTGVHILGVQKKGNKSGSFRLRFHEGGTEERGYTTKKGAYHNTGALKGKWFFKSAVDSRLVGVEQELEEVISRELENL